MDCSPVRLLCPWDSPGKNTGVDSHSLLQRIFPTQELNLGLPCCRQILYHLSHQGNQLNYVCIYVWKCGYIVCACICSVCVCIYTYIYTWCVHMCISVYIHVCIHVCMYMCVYIYITVCACVCIYIHTHSVHVSIYTVYVHVYTCVYTVCVFMYCVCVYLLIALFLQRTLTNKSILENPPSMGKLV